MELNPAEVMLWIVVGAFTLIADYAAYNGGLIMAGVGLTAIVIISLVVIHHGINTIREEGTTS